MATVEMRSKVARMFTTPAQTQYTPATMRVGAQILQVVLSELESANAEAVGTALSIVLAATPHQVREIFERRYVEDRLYADDGIGTVLDRLERELGGFRRGG